MEANGVSCDDSGRDSGHTQQPEMWMLLDFIVSNCTSELSSYLFLYCKRPLSDCLLISEEAFSTPTPLTPTRDGSCSPPPPLQLPLGAGFTLPWMELNTEWRLFPSFMNFSVTGFNHIRDFSVLWVFYFNLVFQDSWGIIQQWNCWVKGQFHF